MLNTFQVPHKKVVEGQHSKIFFLKAFWLWLAVGQIVFQCSLLKKMNTKLAIIWKLDLSKKRGYPRLARFQQNVLQTFFFLHHLFFFHLACNMHIIFPLTALSLDTVYATENFVDENVLKKKIHDHSTVQRNESHFTKVFSKSRSKQPLN